MASDILIVDDEEDIRELVAGILGDEGHETRTAHDADSALAAISERVPRLVFLDIWLQGSRLDGLELLDEIKKLHPGLPVVMISGHGTIETAVSAIRRGAYDFIEKPFNDQMLLDKVQEAIELDVSRRTVLSQRATVMDRLGTLTTRETEVLERVIAGKANKEVAADLGLSEKTIEVHRSRVMKKMRALNAADLIRMVLEARQTPETIA